MFLKCFAVDENVVHVNDDENVDILGQEPVNAFLKSSRSICHSEGKD